MWIDIPYVPAVWKKKFLGCVGMGTNLSLCSSSVQTLLALAVAKCQPALHQWLQLELTNPMLTADPPPSCRLAAKPAVQSDGLLQ